MTSRSVCRAHLWALLGLVIGCGGGEGLAVGPVFRSASDAAGADDGGDIDTVGDGGGAAHDGGDGDQGGDGLPPGDGASPDAGALPCKIDADCPETLPHCWTATGECRACTRAAHCPQPYARCRDGVCAPAVACISDLKCIGAGGVCLVDAGYCVDCLGAADCPAGLQCRGFQCLPAAQPCTISASCAPLGQICDKAAAHCVDCVVHGDCDGSHHCRDGVCAVDRCPPGSAACEGATTLRSCPDGSGWAKKECAPAVCVELGSKPACAAVLCEAGELKCDGDKLRVCGPAGVFWTLQEDCAAGGRSCVGAKCVQTLCAPGTTSCAGSGNAVVKCAPDGMSMSTTSCAPETRCVQGVCVPIICTKGETLCVGDALHICNDAGTGTKLVDTCPQGTDCVGGKCIQLVCQPGAVQCEAGKRKVCAKDASQWKDKPCPPGQACVGGGCKKVVCTPGQPDCDGHKAVACAADGQSSKLIEDCTKAGKACSAGSCVEPVCTPGQHKCQGATLLTCKGDALSWTSLSCLDADPCTMDSCEAAGTCVHAVLKPCKSDPGPSWSPCHGPSGKPGKFLQDDFKGSTLAKAWNPACVGAEPTWQLAGSELQITNTALSPCAAEPGKSWICSDADKGNQICRSFPAGQGGFEVRVKMRWSSSHQTMGLAGLAVTAVDGTIIARMGYRDDKSVKGVPGAVDVGPGAATKSFEGVESAAGTVDFVLRREAGQLKGWANGKQVLDVAGAAKVERIALYTARWAKGSDAFPYFFVAFDSVWGCWW